MHQYEMTVGALDFGQRRPEQSCNSVRRPSGAATIAFRSAPGKAFERRPALSIHIEPAPRTAANRNR